MAGLDGCGKLDISEMSPDNIVVIGNKVWVKAEVEEKIWIYHNRPCTVIKLGEGCYASPCDDLNGIPPALLGAVNFANLFLACRDKPQPPAQDPCAGDNPCSQNYEDPCYKPGGQCEQNNNEETPPGPAPDQGHQRQARSSNPNLNAAQAQELKNAVNNVDIRNINALGWKDMAVIPSAAAIPMKSNISTYGPYASSNFGGTPPNCSGCCGGTQVDVNTDLAPWVFGSITGMNSAGQTLVESTAKGLVKAETGMINIPGMPISQFTQLGTVLGNGGATLSSMSFSYGSNGISTNYEFRTYTPKLGGLSRHLVDRIKDISRNRTEALRFFRNQEIMINKASRQRARFDQQAGIAAVKAGDKGKPPHAKNSLERLFVGQIYDWQKGGQRTVLGTDKLADSVGEMINAYDKKAYVSWDYFYGPISKFGDGNLPRYVNFEEGCHHASTDLPQPPFAVDDNVGQSNSNPLANGLDEYNLKITLNYLDPLTNKVTQQNHHHTGDGRGHVVDMVGRSNEVPDYGIITNFYHLNDENRYSQDYRFFALRGPMLLQSWGYDTQGKPIPNEKDTDADTRTGKFKSTELKDTFMKDWLAKPASWPVAPIDFRFDRKRGVWVTPPGYKIVVAILDEKLNKYGSAQASLINKDTKNNLEFGPVLYDKDGKEIKATDEKETEAKIKVVDRIGITYPAGTKAYCYYDTYKCEYTIIEAAPTKSVRFRIIDLCGHTPVQPDYGDLWTKHAGYGDKFPNNHILGIRIDCAGNTINRKGDFINHNDIIAAINEQNEGDNIDKLKEIFINLFDTCGKFGAARAFYDVNGGQEAFNKWKNEAATGFGLSCDPVSENTCALGERETQCSQVNINYDSYDIIFLDQYARFVECELKQKLYMTSAEVAQKHPNDQYKQMDPEGNAAAVIKHYYGDDGNGIDPKFYKNQGGLVEIDFRVFDPFIESPKDSNPFYQLDYGDRVLAVFDENRKKYIIYQSLKTDEKIIKFALVDNKDIGDKTSRAVLVDLEGYPIDSAGNRLDESNFTNNFITIFDAFAIHGFTEPNPKYHTWATTGFGPALGSEDFNEHLNGITLSAGDWNPPPRLPGGDTTSVWKGGPFIGYAIQRKMTNGIINFKDYKLDNQIIFLESFARFVVGKIASTQAEIEKSYYLGALRHVNDVEEGFIDGRIPFTRHPVHDKANLRISYPIDQHIAGKYITGDFYETYSYGDVYNNVDGCQFIAKLDTIKSKVNVKDTQEKLYYTIIEVDNIANRGRTVILNKELTDQINSSIHILEKSDKSKGLLSDYLDGFMWNKTPGISSRKYEKTTIANRKDWAGKALIMKSKDEAFTHIHTSLESYNGKDGSIGYRITHAGTIAQVGQGTVPETLAGTFGIPLGPINNDNRKISNFNNTDFYHGLNPLAINALDINEQPIMRPQYPWMTYENANIVSLWNETLSNQIERSEYRVVYAREAPVIITGTAKEDFRPEKSTEITIDTGNDIYASCPGVENKPIPSLLTKIQNPMGYGALAGDMVTVQRVYRNGNAVDDANYYYIVIGTSRAPTACY